jgi:hypothetical protein
MKVQEQPDTVWSDRMGSALMQIVPRTLVFTLRGHCDYDHVVELFFNMGRRLTPNCQRVVMDFRWLERTDEETLRFMVSRLSQLARDRLATIYLVKPPEKARSLFSKAPGGEAIRFVGDFEQAILM